MEELEQFARERIGQVVGGKWRLESVLGVGGMAAVYAGRDPHGAVAAVKILHPEMSRRPEVRERFWRESSVANSIDHPGVVRALEHGTTAEQGVYLILELLSGEPLSTRFKRTGTLPVAELLDYLDQILDVLAAAHERGVIHRDLKPDNLFVTTGGRIKILDFGLARFLESVPSDQLTRTGVALGTLPYMAPEQALGRRAEIDGRVDLFALGATAFRILAGRRIHEAQSEAELLIAMATRPAPPLKLAAPHIPTDVCAIVDMALAFSRESRYPNARTMQADVRAVRSGHKPPFATQRNTELAAATRQDSAISAAAAAAQIDPYSATAPMSSLQQAQVAKLVDAQLGPPSRGGTMPMRAFAEEQLRPKNAVAPTAPGTHTMPAVPPSQNGGALAANGVGARSASAVQLPAKKPESRGSGLLVVAGVMFFVLGAAGTVGYYLWSSRVTADPPGTASSAEPIPSPGALEQPSVVPSPGRTDSVAPSASPQPETAADAGASPVAPVPPAQPTTSKKLSGETSSSASAAEAADAGRSSSTPGSTAESASQTSPATTSPTPESNPAADAGSLPPAETKPSESQDVTPANSPNPAPTTAPTTETKSKKTQKKKTSR